MNLEQYHRVKGGPPLPEGLNPDGSHAVELWMYEVIKHAAAVEKYMIAEMDKPKTNSFFSGILPSKHHQVTIARAWLKVNASIKKVTKIPDN